MIYAFRHPIMNRAGQCVLDFDQKQMAALAALINSLPTGRIGEIAKFVIHALHTLYFPSNSVRLALNTYAEPLNAFFALLFLTKDHMAMPLKYATHYCARLQFLIRLRGFHHMFLHAKMTVEKLSTNTVVADDEAPSSTSYSHNVFSKFEAIFQCGINYKLQILNERAE
jgi:hypothetical protein